MPAIYEPRGKAFEYSPLALNLYKGCAHACAYCFAPSATFTERAKFSQKSYIRPRPGILGELEKDAQKFSGDQREILLSFTSDPYQPCEEKHGITRKALEILKANSLRPTILTKAGVLAQRDFDILSTIPGAAFAVTLTSDSEVESAEWEPQAGKPCERIDSLKKAHEAGIKTWVSFEPVINPDAALRLVEQIYPFVDLFKVGKLNYHAHSKTIDWPAFRESITTLLDKIGKPYIIKKDLLAAK
ncbi:hypothetical protein LJC59_00235 [Desulfovibrio sp. OttesenSCG-928-A18]|nr:hypothetical protein [Desulfovibrio sp. OttesenSCG-928-A18]